MVYKIAELQLQGNASFMAVTGIQLLSFFPDTKSGQIGDQARELGVQVDPPRIVAGGFHEDTSSQGLVVAAIRLCKNPDEVTCDAQGAPGTGGNGGLQSAYGGLPLIVDSGSPNGVSRSIDVGDNRLIPNHQRPAPAVAPEQAEPFESTMAAPRNSVLVRPKRLDEFLKDGLEPVF